ncbi:hypothetical protein TWF481_000398 [Arthrobotrys musiformis]|uniref:NACHT domain-containing protein n=1 Tax=Arthrobotrys musiformis TaxID=47236 RepID=A0AAV9WPA3_9PEZI
MDWDSNRAIVIDALDECSDPGEIKTIIELLSRLSSLKYIKVVLTSRPELLICLKFEEPHLEGTYQDFSLKKVPQDIIKRDIKAFFDYELAITKRNRNLTDWSPEESIQALTDMVHPLFIVAATVCRILNDPKHRFDPQHMLEKILEPRSTIGRGLSGVGSTYITVLDQLIGGIGDSYCRDLIIKQFQEIVGTIIILVTPLSINSLASFVSAGRKAVGGASISSPGPTCTVREVRGILDTLQSVLSVPKDNERQVRLLHASFRDFLTGADLKQHSNANFSSLWINQMERDKSIAIMCLEILSRCLRQNICRLKSPSSLRSSIDGETIEKYIKPEAQYACCYWVSHLERAEFRIHDKDMVHLFLQQYFIQWLEALSILGKAYDIILQIRTLQSMIAHDSIEVLEFINDAHRFVLASLSAIDATPLQLYSLSIIFAPRDSIIRKTFIDLIPKWIRTVPEVDTGWGPVLRVWDHDYNKAHAQNLVQDKPNPFANFEGIVRDSVNCGAIEFSPDGKILAFASDNLSITLYDSFTGAEVRTLRGHQDLIHGIKFSRDGKLIVSVSKDRTVKIWNSITGSLKLTLKGHKTSVKAAAFSPDGSSVFSIASDALLQWDCTSGDLQRVSKGLFTLGSGFKFSPNGRLLVSIPDDAITWIWNTKSKQAQAFLMSKEGGKAAINQRSLMVLSHDGKEIAAQGISANGKHRRVGVYSTATGEYLRTPLQAKPKRIYAMAFLPSGQLVVVSRRHRHARSLSLPTHPRWGLEDYDDSDSSIYPGSINLGPWERDFGTQRPSDVVFQNLSTGEHQVIDAWRDTYWGQWSSVIISHDGKLLLFLFCYPAKEQNRSGEFQSQIDVCGSTGRRIRQVKLLSPERISSHALSPGNKLVAAITCTGSITLHDFKTGALLRTLRLSAAPTADRVYHPAREDNQVGLAVRFSRDGKRIASAVGRTINIWDSQVRGAGLLETIEGQWHDIWGIDFASDGNLIVLGPDGAVKVLESGTGEPLQPVYNLEGNAYASVNAAAAISPDNNLLAATRAKELYLWHLPTGTQLLPYPPGCTEPEWYVYRRYSQLTRGRDLGWRNLIFTQDSNKIIVHTYSTDWMISRGLDIYTGPEHLPNLSVEPQMASRWSRLVSRIDTDTIPPTKSMAISPSGLFAMVSERVITLLDPAGREPEKHRWSFQLDRRGNDTLLSIGARCQDLQFWDTSTGVLIGSFYPPWGGKIPPKVLTFSTSASRVFMATRKGVASSSSKLKDSQRHTQRFFDVVKVWNGQIQTKTFSEGWRFVLNRSCIDRDESPPDERYYLPVPTCFSYDTTLFAIAMRDSIGIWDITDSEQAATCPVWYYDESSLVPSEEPRSIAQEFWRTVGSWFNSVPPPMSQDLESEDDRASHHRSFQPHVSVPIGSVISIALSPDNTLLASACEASQPFIKVWDLTKGELCCQWLWSEYSEDWRLVVETESLGLSFSPSGELLMAVGRQYIERTEEFGNQPSVNVYPLVIKIWRSDSGKLQRSFIYRQRIPLLSQDDIQRILQEIAISPDDKLIAMHTTDLPVSLGMEIPETRDVVLLDITTGEEVQKIHVNQHSASLRFSEDGLQLKTEFGVFDVDRGFKNTIYFSQSFHNIAVDGDWISRNGERIIWIPHRVRRGKHELNPYVYGNTVFLHTVAIQPILGFAPPNDEDECEDSAAREL